MIFRAQGWLIRYTPLLLARELHPRGTLIQFPKSLHSDCVRLSLLLVAMAMPQLIAGQNPTPQPPTSQQPLSPKAQRDLVVGKIEAHWTGDLDGMIERRYIRVATTYNKTSYFIDRGVQRGHVYESMQLFVDELNATLKIKNIRVDVVFIPMSREELLPAIVEGRADVAAAALTITSARQQLVDFSPPTRTGVDEIVVTGPGAPTIASLDDLAGQPVFVRKSSAYYENLVRLNAQLKAKGNPRSSSSPRPRHSKTTTCSKWSTPGS